MTAGRLGAEGLRGSATSQISYTASTGGVLSLSRELGVEFGGISQAYTTPE